jgi:hypothetical protein
MFDRYWAISPISEKPKSLIELLKDEAWLAKFCTYKQLRSVIHQRENHETLQSTKLLIESDTEQNFVTVHY